MRKWLACKYKDGEIKVKPYRNEEQMEKILDSGFVKGIIGPYEANTFDEANEIATKNFVTASISNRMVFKKIREMIVSGKTDKEIVDMVKAESKEELIEEELL